MSTTYKVGDRVKLRDYSEWGDYELHNRQVATVKKILEHDDREMDYEIVWGDDETSHVRESNLIAIETQLDAIVDAIVTNAKGLGRWEV